MVIQKNKIDLEKAKREADEAAGVAKAAVEQLKALGFASCESAENELARLDTEIARLEAEASTAYQAFVEKWGNALNGRP